METLWGVLGSGAAACGVACLFASWKKALGGARWLMPMGWLLLVLSAVLWSMARGPEFGISFAVLAIGLFAWLVMAGNVSSRTQRDRSPLPTRSLGVNVRKWGRHLFLFLLAVPVAAVASGFASVALTRLLPWDRVNEMVLAVVLMPVVWGAAAYWVCAASRWTRPGAVFLAGGSLSALIVYM